MDKVSVVIPVYNRANLLPRTLRSIEAQTYRPIELILVDNGSTDNSLAVCLDFQQHFSTSDFSVKVAQMPIGGANAARNKGLELATGTFISFYDSDDEMLPARLEKTVEVLAEKRLDVVFFPTLLQDEEGLQQPKTVLFTTNVEDQVLTSMIATQSFVARTEFIRKIGGWTQGLQRWQDWELGIRILLAKPRCTWLTQTFDVLHQYGADSITGRTFSASGEAILETIRVVHQRLNENPTANRRALRALYFREAQLAALCAKEGDSTFVPQIQHNLETLYPPMSLFRFINWLLIIYTRTGGRGAWKIVRKFL